MIEEEVTAVVAAVVQGEGAFVRGWTSGFLPTQRSRHIRVRRVSCHQGKVWTVVPTRTIMHWHSHLRLHHTLHRSGNT